MTTIAFIGLGNMGNPMAANLVRAGNTVIGFDPAPHAQAEAEAAGLAFADSAVDAARDADVVITMLPNGAIVKTVLTDIFSVAKPGTMFLDCSTISVDDTREINATATKLGFFHADAPVSGGVKGATAGTLAFMIGGTTEVAERAQPILEPMAGKIIHCGPSGNGQAAKLCNNMLLAVQQIAVAEAFTLAAGLGLSAQSLFDVVTGATGNCWAISTNCPVPGILPENPASNDYKPGFATALMNKDLGLAMDAVASAGTSAPLGSHAAQMYSDFAVNNGGVDFGAIIQAL